MYKHDQLTVRDVFSDMQEKSLTVIWHITSVVHYLIHMVGLHTGLNVNGVQSPIANASVVIKQTRTVRILPSNGVTVVTVINNIRHQPHGCTYESTFELFSCKRL